jgi:hypothetical protein
MSYTNIPAGAPPGHPGDAPTGRREVISTDDVRQGERVRTSGQRMILFGTILGLILVVLLLGSYLGLPG